jgi:predicted membrane channel-forming protein YqfA (hemolysin III family)
MDLINYNDLPDWYKDNEYIKTGYRKVNNCVYLCCESVFEIYNETTNIWTHLLGAVQFLILCVFTLFDDLKLFSRLSLSFFCLTVANNYLLHVYIK